MNYLAWTFIALVAYTLFPPFVNLASSGGRPSMVVALVSTAILATTALGVVAFQGELDPGYLTGNDAHFLYLAGVTAAVGVLAYIHALSNGPVSIVVPVFGMFIVTSSAVGVLFLSEPLTARKVLGVGFAAVALYLIAG